MKKVTEYFIYLLLFLLPTQLGKFFFLDFSFISGVRIDYLAPAIFLTDIVALILIIMNAHVIVPLFRSKKVWIFFGLVLINIVFSLSPWITIYRWLKVLEFVCLFLVIKKTKLDNELSLKIIFVSTALQLFLVLLQFYSRESVQGLFYFLGERYFSLSSPDIAKASLNGIEILRPYGSFSHPNSMGGFYVLLYAFLLVSNRFQKHFWLKTSILFMCTLLVFMSFSKVVIASFVILNITYLIAIKKYKDCKFCFASRLITLFVVSGIFLLAHGDPDSLDKRLMLTRDSLKILSNDPFFGVGLGSYLVAQSVFPIKYAYYFLQPVHNIFLLFLTEAGAVITCWIVYHLYKVRDVILSNKKALYLLFVIIFTGFFDHYWITLQQNALAATVLLALIFSEPTLKTKPK